MCCVEGHSCPLSDTYLDLGTIGVGCIDEIQYCAEVNGWTVGTENCVEGHHGTSLDVLYIPWRLRDGMDRPDSTILGCLICPLGLRDGMDI